MTCKVIVQKGTFADSLAIVGRAIGSHSHLPILSNVLLNKDEGQLRLSATDLNYGRYALDGCQYGRRVGNNLAYQDFYR